MAHCDVAFTAGDAPRDVLILEPICDMRLQRKQRLCSTYTPPRSDTSPLFTGRKHRVSILALRISFPPSGFHVCLPYSAVSSKSIQLASGNTRRGEIVKTPILPNLA